MKLLVVDDEANIRDGIQQGIDWASLGIDEVLVASGGQQAIGLARQHRPEIVISDISMPGMDGLTLIETLQDFMPQTRYIILSGYSEFEYAKRAIRLNVVDYELKPIKVKRLIDLVVGIRAQILEEWERQQRLQAYRESSGLRALRDAALGTPPGSGRPGELATLLGWPPTDRVGCAVLEQDYHPQEDGGRAQGIAEALFSEAVPPGQGYLVAIQPGRLLAVRRGWESAGDEAEIQAFFRRVNDALRPMGCSMSMGLGGTGSLDDLPHLYTRALCILDHRLYEGPASLARCGEAKPRQETVGLVPRSTQTTLLQLVESQDAAALAETLHGLFSGIAEKRQMGLAQVRELSRRLAAILLAEVGEGGDGEAEELAAEYSVCRRDVLADIEAWLVALGARVVEQVARRGVSAKNPLILRSLDYIRDHYAEDVTVDTMAELLAISPNYFSHLFNREMSVSFREHLNRVRVSHAKYLLTSTSLLTYQVAERVGFKDYKHFSRVFKSFAGCSPNRYRNRGYAEREEKS